MSELVPFAGRSFTWRFWQDPATGCWVGASDQLGMTAEGETFGQMREDVDHTLVAVESHLRERGELEAFLRQVAGRPTLIEAEA